MFQYEKAQTVITNTKNHTFYDISTYLRIKSYITTINFRNNNKMKLTDIYTIILQNRDIIT